MSSQPQSLPVLVLPYPRILFPTTRISIPVNRTLSSAIQTLLKDNPDGHPHVLAIPTCASGPEGDETPKVAKVGSIARIVRLAKAPMVRGTGFIHFVTLQGVGTRARPLSTQAQFNDTHLHQTEIELLSDNVAPSLEHVEAFRSAALVLLNRYSANSTEQARRDGWRKVQEFLVDMTVANAHHVANLIVGTVDGDHSDKLDFLTSPDADARLISATKMIVKQTSISEVSQKIKSDVNESLSKQQKEYYLRQQLAAIQRELQQLHSSGEGSRAGGGTSPSELDDDSQQDQDELDDLKRKIEAMEKDSEERKTCVREWRRMKRIQPSSVEHGVVRSYLEWVVALPWAGSLHAIKSDEALLNPRFLKNARQQLDDDHFGLEKIKRRLVEHLAIVRLKRLEFTIAGNRLKASQIESPPAGASPSTSLVPKGMTKAEPRKSKGIKGPILLFIGPPGVGKTSLGKSIARAVDRPFQRISLGGIRDEAEIRGHRRTYVASGPGVIVQALRKAGRLDSVILLDEIDKLAQSNHQGDPGAALLEVLDPEQNHSFNDHYINIPIDLSQVLFICTANSLDTISAPLLDRCEVIQLSGYTYDEKLNITTRFLLPKQIEANALTNARLEITDLALTSIVTKYTREAGVRSLERSIGAVARYKALEWAEFESELQDSNSNVQHLTEYSPTVDEQDLEKILGPPWWNGDELDRHDTIGVVYGLVVSGVGEGSTMPIESTVVPGTGKLKLTGSLGDVIKESAELALTWIRAHAFDLSITTTPDQDPLQHPRPIDIHLHLPSGAQKKDGPSAGIAMVCALVSLLTGMCIPASIAMTGEITLRGRVGPVGGIKEKVIGAHRAQIKKVIIPWANRKDVEHDVTAKIRNSIEFVFVQTIEEVIQAAFGKGVVHRRMLPVYESRL